MACVRERCGKELGTCDEDTFKPCTRHLKLDYREKGKTLSVAEENDQSSSTCSSRDKRLDSILLLAPGLPFLEGTPRLGHWGSLDFLEFHKAEKNEARRGQEQVRQQVSAACH